MLDKVKYTILAVTLFLFSFSVSVRAGLYDWGVKGVSDTVKVEKVLQFTDNPPYSDAQIGPYGDPWNSDGSWILYTVEDSSYYHALYKMRADGSDVTKLSGNAVDDSNASFGSDGRIYFERYDVVDAAEHIFRMEKDGTLRDLTVVHGGDSELYVRPSPDATLIAYLDLTGHRLKVAKNDGTYPIAVSGTQIIYEPHHDWSPDSQWLAYKGNDNGNEWVYKVRPDGTSRTALTEPALPSFVTYSHLWPTWSPNGRNIVYIHRYQFDSDYTYSLRVISAEDGSVEQSLDSATTSVPGWQHISGPLSWSPDGKWIAYWKTFSGPGAFRAICIAPSDGSSPPVQLTTGYNDFKPFWSPDGSRILFVDSASSTSRDGNGYSDLLLLKMRGSYGKFPWPMFLPAITNGRR